MQGQRWRAWVVPALASLIVACQHSVASPPANITAVSDLPTVAADDNRVPGEWLVTVRPGVSATDLMTRYRKLGVLMAIPVSAELYLLRFPPNRSPSEVQVRADGATDVVAVQPNFRYRSLPSAGPRLQ